MYPYLGEIKMFGGNFAPKGWALCNGQLMSISQNSALFSILGTNFGGDGIQTFGLPDYRGTAPMHWGTGLGLSPEVIGERSGTENVTLLQTEMPIHNHNVNASTTIADQLSPAVNILGESADSGLGTNPTNFIAPSNINTTMAPTTIGMSGGSLPHDNMQPYLVVSFIIALQGVFPSRN